jgi:hypothetical protein
MPRQLSRGTALLGTRILSCLVIAVAAVSALSAVPGRAEIISVAEVGRGTTIGRDECAKVEQTVWIEALGRNFCMRYYFSEAGGNGARPLVMLQGDQIGRANLRTRTFHIREDAVAVDTATLVKRTNSLSGAARGPAIYLARVGLDGSSGHHIIRRTILELEATNAALHAIKEKHSFEGFHLVGQSAGATLIAGLLSARDDIACAVMGAGRLSSIRTHVEPDEPALEFFDPAHTVARLARTQARILVVTDPEDRIAPAVSQSGFVTRVREVGERATQFFVTASDENRHAVSSYSVMAAVGCMRGESDATIAERLALHAARRSPASQVTRAESGNPVAQNASSAAP